MLVFKRLFVHLILQNVDLTKKYTGSGQQSMFYRGNMHIYLEPMLNKTP